MMPSVAFAVERRRVDACVGSLVPIWLALAVGSVAYRAIGGEEVGAADRWRWLCDLVSVGSGFLLRRCASKQHESQAEHGHGGSA